MKALPQFLANLLLCILLAMPGLSLANNQHKELQLRFDQQKNTHSQPNKMRKGLVEIKHIRLQGDALFPEYGIDENFLHQRVNQVYSHMGEQLSIQDMNKIADALTLAYREKGLTFNQAYIIPQEITEATLTLHILKGVLAEVDIFNNQLYQKNQILTEFDALIGEVIYEPKIKQVIAKLNQKPGLQVFSFFSLGSKQGEARLNIRIMKEEAHFAEVGLDNKGIEQTGIYRGYYKHTVNNPFNKSGQLQGSLYTSEQRENYYGSLSYHYPIALNNQLSLSVLKSDFAIFGQFSKLGLSGELTSLAASWSRQASLRPHSLLQHNMSLTLAKKQSKVSSDIFSELFKEETNYTMLSLSYQLQQGPTKKRHYQQIMTISPSFSQLQSSTKPELEKNFWLARASYQYTHLGLGKELTIRDPLLIKANAQYSQQAIPPSEQFSLTGPKANRGFQAGSFSSDTGITLSIEQEMNWTLARNTAKKNNSLTPFIFYDFSYGRNNLTPKLAARFQSIGVGLKRQFNSRLNASMSLAKPINTSIAKQLDSQHKRTHLFAQINYRF
jgi:hemolysin activation/secretion protein